MINDSPSQVFTSFNPNQSAQTLRSRNVSDMGSDDFLALMIAQMKNQDPTKPMDQMAFMSQLAQFGTLSGVQELNAEDDCHGDDKKETTPDESQAKNTVQTYGEREREKESDPIEISV